MIGFETTTAAKIKSGDDVVMWGSLEILHVTKVHQEQNVYHLTGTLDHAKMELTARLLKDSIVERLIIIIE